MVMTKGTEEQFKLLNGREVDIEIMAEDEEESLDGQEDYEIKDKKKYDDDGGGSEYIEPDDEESFIG